MNVGGDDDEAVIEDMMRLFRDRQKEKYEKLEVSFPVSAIKSIQRVTKRSAQLSVMNGRDMSRSANTFDRILRTLVTKVELDDGTVLFFEMIDHKEFVDRIRKFREEP